MSRVQKHCILPDFFYMYSHIGIMYSQFGVVPLLYLRYTSVVHFVYLCCTSYFPLLFPSCAPVLPLLCLLYLSCSFEVPLLFLCLEPEDIEMISRCQMHSCPFFVPHSPIEWHCLQWNSHPLSEFSEGNLFNSKLQANFQPIYAKLCWAQCAIVPGC